MTVPILDSSAWREFRGKPNSSGINNTIHLAKIADMEGKLHDCFVKLLPLNYPSLLGEAIGWLLTRSTNVPCAKFAAIVLVPLDQLRKNIDLPLEFDNEKVCPAWCCEVIPGNSLRQIHKWDSSIVLRKCLRSVDARKIASFDIWTDLRDRNCGNVIKSSNGGYISIDHETILHDLLWLPSGRGYDARSLLTEAQQHLPFLEFQRFQVDMAKASEIHAKGLALLSNDLAEIVHKIYPHLSDTMAPEIIDMLKKRAQVGWLANTLGVIA